MEVRLQWWEEVSYSAADRKGHAHKRCAARSPAAAAAAGAAILHIYAWQER